MSGATEKLTELSPYPSRSEVSLVEAASGKYPFIAFGCSQASLWVSSEFDEEFNIYFVVESLIPHPYGSEDGCHAFEYENDTTGIDDLIAGYESTESWLLKKGIAPFQPFRIMFTGNYWGPDCSGEYDSSVDVELLEVGQCECGSPLANWEEWLKGVIQMCADQADMGDISKNLSECITDMNRWGDLAAVFNILKSSDEKKAELSVIVSGMLEEDLTSPLQCVL